MVEDNYIDGQEAAFGAFNFKLTRPETYDEIQVTEEYQEPATLIRSLKDHEKADRVLTAIARSDSYLLFPENPKTSKPKTPVPYRVISRL